MTAHWLATAQTSPFRSQQIRLKHSPCHLMSNSIMPARLLIKSMQQTGTLIGLKCTRSVLQPWKLRGAAWSLHFQLTRNCYFSLVFFGGISNKPGGLGQSPVFNISKGNSSSHNGQFVFLPRWSVVDIHWFQCCCKAPPTKYCSTCPVK